MSAEAQTHEYEMPALFEELWRSLVLTTPVHDDVMPGEWLCGRCPYANRGAVCTKCGAFRYEGTEVPVRGQDGEQKGDGDA